jgi:Zn-finger nucleic acid-binding protein
MTCGMCGKTMQELVVGVVTLDHCPGCSALWFDATELVAVLAWAAEPAPVEVATRSGPGPDSQPTCPRHDRVALARRDVQNHEVWCCPRCRGLLVPAVAWEGLVARKPSPEEDAPVGAAHGAASVLQALGELLTQ